MKKIVLGLLLVLCAGHISLAQVQQGDLLISHSDYQKMKAEIASTKKELDFAKTYKSKVDSIITANNRLMGDYAEISAHNQRIIRASTEREQYLLSKVQKLELQNAALKNQLDFQRIKTNEYRFAFQNSGRFKDKAQVSTLWAGLMSVAFLLALNDERPQASYIVAAGSAVLTIGLAINFSKQTGK